MAGREILFRDWVEVIEVDQDFVTRSWRIVWSRSVGDEKSDWLHLRAESGDSKARGVDKCVEMEGRQRR